MKNIYIAYFLLIILSSCGNKKIDSVSLSGEIKGLGNDTLYIYGADNMYYHIDTLIVKDDKFSSTLFPDTLVATWILFSDGARYPLFMNKGDKLQIKGSASELNALEITGNIPNEELTAFQNSIKGLGKPSEKVLEEKAGKFIDTHPSSLVSIYLLDKYFIQKAEPNYNQIKEFIERMTGELKDRPTIDDMDDLIQEEEKAEIGDMAPYFHLPNAKGKEINRSEFKDKYLLLHFWASWDALSREENATLRRIYKKQQKNKRLAFLGISLDIEKEKWQQAIKTDSLKWEQVCDSSSWEMDIVKQLAIRTLPANILLNPLGRIEGKNMNEEALEKKFKEIEEKEKKEKVNR